MGTDAAHKAKTDKAVMLSPEMAKRAEELSQEFARSPRHFYVGLMALAATSHAIGLVTAPLIARVAAMTLETLRKMKAAKEGEARGERPGQES